MKRAMTQVEKITRRTANDVLDITDTVTAEVVKKVDTYVAPVRTSALKRFPILFSFLVTFGVATTYYAFEKILGQYAFLNEYPWMILVIGIGTLALTGTLYKKLS
jgi:uncharacterized integral membrane protein